MGRAIFILSLLSLCQFAHSQNHPQGAGDVERLADEIFPVQDLDLDYSVLYENLAQLLANPINLNTATEEQLRSTFILNEKQLGSLMKYRSEQGRFLSVHELQAIPDFDLGTVRKLLPFITVQDEGKNLSSLPKRVWHEKNNYFLLRYERTLETKSGFLKDTTSSSRFRGSPDHIYSRFRVARASDFSFGFTLEKDAGEGFLWSNKQLGFDYTSVHAQIINKGKLKNLILGDFQAQFGQGLLLGGGFGIGKGAEPITTVRKGNTGFSPYTSLNEAAFFRGIAGTINPAKNIFVSGFFSHTGKDGNISGDSTGSALSSFSTTGLHRTASELENRKSLDETNFGAVASLKERNLEAGIIFHHTHFSLPLNRTPTLNNQFAFAGNANTNTGIFMNYSRNNFTFFSEVATTWDRGKGWVTGILGSLSTQLDIALLYRHYDRNFQSLYGNSFSENTTPQNESGYYLGWKYKFNRKYTLAGYTDFFKFPWLRFRGTAPSSGSEWLVRLSVQPSREVILYLQAREESKIRNRADINLFATENAIKRNFWINMDYPAGKSLRFKSRIQFSTFSHEQIRTSGFAIIQDLNFTFNRIDISARYALFDTDNFDNRQYVYEQDVWLAYSIPFYNGTGIRSYILLHYAPSKKVDLWIRWARTHFTDRDVIGSGNEAIVGNSRNDLTLQTRFKL